jgi:hypothetical protein
MTTNEPWMRVACPKCGAKIGEACKRMRYAKDVAMLTPMASAHRVRVLAMPADASPSRSELVRRLRAYSYPHSGNPEILMAEAADALDSSLEPITTHWAVFCALCKKEWFVNYQHPGKSICEDCERKHAER